MGNVNMTIQLYGIPNCATVKKARAWLDEYHIAYQFINFKTQAPTRHHMAQTHARAASPSQQRRRRNRTDDGAAQRD